MISFLRALLVGIATIITGVVACGAEPPAIFTFAVLGDPHPLYPCPTPEKPPFHTVVNDLNALAPDFVVIVGDFILGPDKGEAKIRKMWDDCERFVGRIESPVKRLPGNHDIWDEPSRRIYVERFGPSYYSFDYEGCHFVMLDSESGAAGRCLDKTQYNWLRDDLTRNKNARFTFVFIHQPLWATPEKPWYDEVHPLLVEGGVDRVYAGHAHVYQYHGERDGIAYTTTGGGGGPIVGNTLGGSFRHFVYLRVLADQVRSVVMRSGLTMPHDRITERMVSATGEMRTAMTVPPLDLSELETHGSAVTGTTIPNSLADPARLVFKWSVEESPGWHVEPSDVDTIIPPGGQTELSFKVSRESTASVRRPRYSSTVTVGDLDTGEMSGALVVSRKTICPRIESSDSAPVLKVARGNAPPIPKDERDYSASARLRHDGEYLFVDVDVADDDIIVGDPTVPSSSDKVAVALFVGGLPAPPYCWTLAGFVSPEGSAGRVNFWPEKDGASGSAELTEGGYRASLRVPFSALGMDKVTTGDKILCEIAVIDVDSDQNRPTVMQWGGHTTFFVNVSEYGIVELQ